MRKTKTLFNTPAAVESQKAIIKVGNTPIEIALGIDEQGRTTAKKLYSFLELNQSNYSKWCKRNITENDFAEENVDYWAFVLHDERNYNPNPTTDYILTATFAKKLAMASNSAKGDQAREYFIKVEELLKQAVTAGQGRYSGQPIIQKVCLDDMELLTMELAKTRYNMGYSTLRKSAEDCSAIVRIYGRVLYSRRRLDKYFENLACNV
ncbi:MAG: antA/AntB antirepressor family protein [Lachnospiraceae bacterium]|nr:antA/AntB antirepressor family protein [Lachnospiraceae bacterium]